MLTKTIYPLRYRKSDLEKAPADERMLFLPAGHFSNDIALLQKQLLFSLAPAARAETVQRPAGALALLSARLLINRLVAAWEFIKKDKWQALVVGGFQYLREIGGPEDTITEAEAAFKVLEKELLDGGALSRIRRKTAAHQDQKLMADAYDAMPEGYEFVDLLADEASNTLYSSCDDVATRVLLDIAIEGDPAGAIKMLGDLVATTSGAMTRYFQAYITAFQLKYLGEAVVANALKAGIEVPSPMIKTATIPFFVSRDV